MGLIINVVREVGRDLWGYILGEEQRRCRDISVTCNHKHSFRFGSVRLGIGSVRQGHGPKPGSGGGEPGAPRRLPK